MPDGVVTRLFHVLGQGGLTALGVDIQIAVAGRQLAGHWKFRSAHQGVTLGFGWQRLDFAIDRAGQGVSDIGGQADAFVIPEGTEQAILAADKLAILKEFAAHAIAVCIACQHPHLRSDDQSVRMFLREAGREIGLRVRAIGESLCRIGEAYDDVLMPGYTHEQRAMPSTPALWAMGYAELLLDDLTALRHAADAINISPAGTAAGYGVPLLPLPREEMARGAGFRGLQLHVTATQISRGKLEMQFVHALVQIAATLNRLATDLVLYNSEEFGFVKLPDEMCTGSSIMPQKKNPDVFELARAGFHRIAAEMQLLQTLPANLPSGYHRDLQLTKEAVMRATLRASDLVTAMDHGLSGVEFDRERLRASLTPDLFATAEALRLVQEGTPFRDAYREAADSLSQLQVPADADALAAYLSDGYPGRCRPDIVSRRFADDYADWLGS